MSQAELTDFDPALTSGVELAVLMKASEAAIHSTHSGVSRPSYVTAGMMWIDTSSTPWRLKIYGGSADYDLGSIGDNAFGELVGRISDYAGVDLPDGYLWCDGSAVSRATYDALYEVLTKSVTGTTTNTSTTISSVSSDLQNKGLVGAKIEGSGIPAGATIVSITASTIVISAAATASASGVSIRIFPHGNGNGSTSFNVPDRRGRVPAGRDDMGGSAASVLTSAGGLDGSKLTTGGAQTVTLTTAQLPAHTHTASASGTANSGGAHTHTVTGSVSGTTSTGGSHEHNVRVSWGSTQYAPGGFYAVDGAQDTNTTAVDAAGLHNHTFSASLTSGLATSDGAHTHTLTVTVTVDNAGSGDAHSNVQPTAVTNFIIKT